MFDIDKLGLSTINWKVEKGKATDQFEEGSEEYYQNQLIRDFITMLIDKDTVNILHRSIDNDTKLLTDIVKELESSSSTREEPYGFYSLSTQTERKNDYITGKIGIGPFALNNNNHILTMLYGVRFKENPTSIMTILGLNNLASTEDAENNSIMSWISALINAHVDIAKDPYISKLNVNPYTYNLVNTLIRTGFGKNTFYFTTQPIMKDLARVYMNASSAYMSDSDKSIYALQKEATEKLAESLFKDEKIGESSYEDLLEVSDPNSIGARTIVNDIFKLLVDNGTIHRNANKSWDSITGATVKLNDKDLHLTPNQVQMIVYLANLEFAPYAQSVSNLVKYSKIDTKKHGKSYIEQLIFKEGFDDLFTDRDTGKLFEEEGIRDMAKDSYIYTKTVNAIEMTKAILAGQFLQSTSAFDNARIKVLGMIGRTGSKDIDLNNKVVRMIMAAIKSEFINDYASNLRPDNPTYMRDLVSESEEELSYRLDAGSKTLKISGNKYPLTSYIGGNAEITFTAAKSDKMQIGFTTGVGVVVDRVDNENDATYTMRYPILGADDSTGEIITPFTRKLDSNGKIVITGGKNTIYDRFNRLLVQLKTDPEYRDVVDGSGEPMNMLLRSMVRGKTYQYKPKHPSANIFKEMPDTYDTLKFVKLFNALDQNGVISNYVIDGWDLLLHDNKEGHEELKRFAEDLVVYAFITSGDSNGFTKMFKLVPYTWRKESGYGEFIRGKISDFQVQDINEEQLLDAILNNWFDNDIVRTYYSTHTSSVDGKSQIPNFITYSGETAGRGLVPQYNPLIVAALKYNEETGKHEPSIDPNNAPVYIKIPRRNNQNGKNTQRRYTVYRRADYGMKQNEDGKWITYPIYVKVEPKGNQIEGNYLITEYGRSDAKNPEKTASTESLQKIYKIGDFISRTAVDDLKDKFGMGFADIVESLNYKHVLEDVYSGDLLKFDKAFNKQGESDSNSRKLNIIPIKQLDKKATAKGSVANKFIGFADGITGSSTAEYAKQAGSAANVGNYSQDDVIFVSIPGMRGDADIRHREQQRTIDEAIKALNSGATLITDNALYVANSTYNEGEKLLAEALTNAGAIYSDMNIDGTIVGKWTLGREKSSEQDIIPASYEGLITSDENTIFVFGSNPEGRHGSGAAKVAREQFGAVYGQGEGLQGNSYALPTKRIKNIIPNKSGQMTFSYGNNKRPDVNSSTTFEAIINGERTATTRYTSDGNIDYWKDLKLGDIVAFKSADNKGIVYVRITKPLTKLNSSTDAEEWSKKEGWSVDYYNDKVKPKVEAGQAYQMEYEFVDANGEKTITPQQITDNIRKMYEVARQNPSKQFKVAYTNGLNETSLNGYTGAEMIKMFKDAGPIPSNVIFSKNWTDHWNETSNADLIQVTDDQRKEAEEIRKQCKGE